MVCLSWIETKQSLLVNLTIVNQCLSSGFCLDQTALSRWKRLNINARFRMSSSVWNWRTRLTERTMKKDKKMLTMQQRARVSAFVAQTSSHSHTHSQTHSHTHIVLYCIYTF